MSDDADRELEEELREQEINRLFLTARLLLKQNRLDELQSLIDQLQERRPDNSEVFELQGDLLRRRGKRKPAQEAYKRASELDSTNADAERKFAELALFLGEEERARRRQQELVEEPGKSRPQPRNPIIAAIYAFVFPGFGQLYNREHEKGLVLLGGAVIIVMLLVNGLLIVPLQAIGHEVKTHGGLRSDEQYAVWREHLSAMPTWQWILVVLGGLIFTAMQVYGIIDAYRTARRETEEAKRYGI